MVYKVNGEDEMYKKVYTDVQNAYIQEHLLRTLVNAINWDIVLEKLLIDSERKARVIARINANMEYLGDITARSERILGVNYVSKKVQSIGKHKTLSAVFSEARDIRDLTPNTTDYYYRTYGKKDSAPC